MAKTDRKLRPGSAPDPFGERPKRLYRERALLLGGSFEFESSSRALLRLVEDAYGGLPRHRLPGEMPRFRIRLHLTPGDGVNSAAEPPPTQLQGGAGLLTVVMDAANFAVISPAERTGLVAISSSMLRFSPQVRYELLEFAVFALAHRGQGLVSLHAACVGWKQRGLLLIGESGAGKSVLSLHCALRGLDFLTEDATFVVPETMLATGVSNFLHVKEDSLHFLHDAAMVSRISKIACHSPSKRRGKIRDRHAAPAPPPGTEAPDPLGHRVRVQGAGRQQAHCCAPSAGGTSSTDSSRARPTPRTSRNWKTFVKGASTLPALELRRGRHPADGVDALRGLLIE